MTKSQEVKKMLTEIQTVRRNRLVNEFGHVVFEETRRYAETPCVEIEDLVAAGVTGLVEAATEFVESRQAYSSAKFSTVAAKRVREAVKAYISVEGREYSNIAQYGVEVDVNKDGELYSEDSGDNLVTNKERKEVI